MPAKPTAKQLYEELLRRYGQSVADAFFASIQDLRDAADLQRAITALKAGDIASAIAALHIEPAAYNGLLDRIVTAYGEGGAAATNLLPAKTESGVALVVRFDVRNPTAEAWLRLHSSDLVTGIVADQRTAVRRALEAGLAAGRNPTTTALDIVGRVDRATGQRVGGVLGLTSTQEEWARNARAELQSGDPAQLKAYLKRSVRDKRFDRTVQKALDSGQPVPADIVGKAVDRYRSGLLKLRGELIGKEETFRALAASRQESFRQAIANGSIAQQAVTKTWRHFPNENPRHEHIAMNGKKVGFNESFVLPDGTPMLYPHDPSAPLSQTAGCHCQADYEVDFLAGLS